MSWLFFKQGTGIAPPCRYNERREKQAAAQQTFVAKHVEEAPVTRPLTFHKPLTKVPPKFLSNTTERTYPNEKT